MRDEQAVAELLVRYGFAMDTRSFGDLPALLTADAVFSLEIAGLPEAPPAVHGAQEIADWIAGTISSHDNQLRHVMTNFRFDRTGEGRLRLGAYLTLHATVDGALETSTTGVYDCDAVSGADGTWRFARIHIAFDRPF